MRLSIRRIASLSFSPHSFAARVATLVLALSCMPPTASVARAQDVGFSKRGWLPKAETGALRFLEQHADYDGRGVVVAIFDTGVDPGVDGLQTTPDGRPKIIDMVDGSGSGDVDTAEVREAKDGKLLGLTGRSLSISKRWRNPTGKYHVGWKRGYELFPRDLLRRVTAARQKDWDKRQRALQARMRGELIAWDEANPKPNEQQQHVRQELALRVELLEKAQGSFKDPGPIYDCVVFHDGKHWQAVIDTDEDGDLADEKVMMNYRVRRQYATFDAVSLVNFAVNIYDDGKLLSIVTDCGTHGTHVAGIVAAHYPNHPERNGLAPGAQIVSVKIGDRRLGSSSTGVGQIRGLTAVLRNRCDIINMSYGGATGFPNEGRLLERYSEVVHERGVLFVASAGNNGPALSTVGSPGGVSSALFGVGAYVSPDLMKYAYAQRADRDEQAFTWTSRGPVADGDLGVDICAPGGAISPVSKWSLQHRRLANGTSMSSPNVAGNLALMLSGLKAENVSYSPTSVRRAVVNTARALKGMDPLAHGRGMIQIDRAFDYAIKHREYGRKDARFEVRIDGRNDARGVYLRSRHEAKRPHRMTVQVRPRLSDRDANDDKRTAFDLAVRLESKASWIKAPEQLVMNYSGKSFALDIDPTKLKPGVHYEEVVGFDADSPECGPLFRIPVTVVRSHSVEKRSYNADVKLDAGAESRHFLSPPRGSTWVDLALTADVKNQHPQRYVLHVLQQTPDQGIGRNFQREYITLQPGESILRSFAVTDDLTLEVCLAQLWSSIGNDNRLTLQTRFHGLRPEPSLLSFATDQHVTRVDVSGACGDHWVSPEAKLTTLRRSLSANDFQVRPASTGRDQLPNERRLFESIATYAFSLDEAMEVRPWPTMSLTPNFSATWESRLWQIFDANKRLMGSGTGGDLKLEPGDYTLRLHLRHDDPKQLERWESATVWLDMVLPKPIAVPCFMHPADALAGKPQAEELFLRDGARAVFYWGSVKPPAHAKVGDRLIGSFTLGSESKAVASAGRKPRGFRIEVMVSPLKNIAKASTKADAAKKSDSAKGDHSPGDRNDPPFWLEARRKRLGELRQAGDHEAHAKLVAEILAEHPKDVPTLIERLTMLDDDDRKKRLPQIVAAADAVSRRINVKQLAQRLGVRANDEDPAIRKQRALAEKQRDQLVDALYRKGRAIAYMDLPPVPGAPPMEIPKKPKKREARDKLFESNYAQLRRWVDLNEPKYALLKVRRERRLGRPATALKVLESLREKQPYRELLYKKRGDIYGELGWDHWQAYEKAWKIIRFPKAYPPF